MSPGSPIGSNWKGQRLRRKLVLFSGSEDFVMEIFDEHRKQRRWHMMAIPLDLFERIGEAEFRCGSVDLADAALMMEHQGVPRAIAAKWPQRLGFRIVLELSERGRIAFGLLTGPRDIKRAMRVRVDRWSTTTYRVEGPDILAALRAAGSRLRGAR